jgi:hypothetical protein
MSVGNDKYDFDSRNGILLPRDGHEFRACKHAMRKLPRQPSQPSTNRDTTLPTNALLSEVVVTVGGVAYY